MQFGLKRVIATIPKVHQNYAMITFYTTNHLTRILIPLRQKVIRSDITTVINSALVHSPLSDDPTVTLGIINSKY